MLVIVTWLHSAVYAMRSEDSPEVFKMLRGPHTIGQKTFVPILYRNRAFEAFGDLSDFLESISYEP